MKISARMLIPLDLMFPMLLSLGGCGCGFDCNNSDSDNDNNNPAQLTLGFSDSIPEDLKEVVIEVDSITFQRSGADDVVVDTFTIPGLNLTDADTFQVDLLDYPGFAQLKVITDLELDAANYPALLIDIVANGINSSYVLEADDTEKPITVDGGILTLDGGMQLSSGNQAFTVEFSLAQSLQLQTNDEYLLATDGIRIENNSTDAVLSGSIASSLFDTASDCAAKPDPEDGNRVYLYEGIGLSTDDLADVFTTGSSITPPDTAVAPFAVASLTKVISTGNWVYAFGYVPAGDYTMAFSCNTAEDDAVEYNGLEIPLPTDQVYSLTLSESENAVCNLAEGASC